MVLIDFPHIKHINFKSMKILSSNMPSIHKIYGYGNIAIGELFNIDISEKVHNTEEEINEMHHSIRLLQDAMEVLPRMQPYRTMTTIVSEHSRGISNSLTLSNRLIVLKMTETHSVSTLQAVQLTLTKHFSVFYTSKQETQACIHIYRTRPLWKCTENPDDS